MKNKALLLLIAILVLMFTACPTPTTVYVSADRYAVLESANYWEGNFEDGTYFSIKFYGDMTGDAVRDARYNLSAEDVTYASLGWDSTDYTATNDVGFGDSEVTYGEVVTLTVQ